MNRMKYFFYFLKKIFMYKKYFFYFFFKQNLSYFHNLILSFFSSFNVIKKNVFTSTYASIFLRESIYSDFSILSDYKNNTKKMNNMFFLFFFSLFLKLFFFMFKNLNSSYFALPIKRNKITILRSPHIDKKSREQFELKHFYIVLNELSMFSLSKNDFLFNQFRFFLSSFKLDEKNEFLIK